MLLSIVSPVYRSYHIVEPLVTQIIDAVQKITDDFEIVLVDDGSPDKDWIEIERMATLNNRVKGIKLSRNFGHNFAITAGLNNAKGDYVVVMDCDLQENPIYIAELYKKIQEGYEIIFTEKPKREFGFFKNLTSTMFLWACRFLIDDSFMDPINNNIGNMSMLSRKAVNAFLSFNDYRRQYLAVLRWIGFRAAFVQTVHQKRHQGKSSYTFFKMWKLALDTFVTLSDKLLRITVSVGFALSFIAFLSTIGIVIRYFFEPFAPGWASLAVLIIFVGGIITLSVGICGLYIGKTFEQTKHRPMYIIDETINMENLDNK